MTLHPHLSTLVTWVYPSGSECTSARVCPCLSLCLMVCHFNSAYLITTLDLVVLVAGGCSPIRVPFTCSNGQFLPPYPGHHLTPSDDVLDKQLSYCLILCCPTVCLNMWLPVSLLSDLWAAHVHPDLLCRAASPSHCVPSPSPSLGAGCAFVKFSSTPRLRRPYTPCTAARPCR